MDKQRKNVPVILLVVMLISLTGFRNTGILIMDHSIKDAENTINFAKGTEFEVKEETEKSVFIEKYGILHEIPKEKVYKTPVKDNEYEVVKDLEISGENGKTKHQIKKGEIVKVEKLEGTKGLVASKDGVKGELDLSNLTALKEKKPEVIAQGRSRVDKELVNEHNKKVTLKQGEVLNIIENKENNYIILDGKGNRYKLEKQSVKLITDQAATRGATKKEPAKKQGRPTANKVVAAAHRNIGRPYVHGDTGKRGFDCSGLTYSIYLNEAGIKLPRTSGGQASAGRAVKKSDLLPGDLVFFRTGGKNIGHVGVYIGNGKMIHASTSRKSMIVASINSSYFGKRYVTARRIVD